jgi:hypothetical protein
MIIITEKSWIICPIAISVTIIINYLKIKGIITKGNF